MNKKYFRKAIIFLTIVATIFFLLHFSPSMAIRSHVFILGYPKSAITSEIVEYVEANELNQEEFANNDMKMYSISNPPVARDTKNILGTFLVTKKGIFYFAEYAGGL